MPGNFNLFHQLSPGAGKGWGKALARGNAALQLVSLVVEYFFGLGETYSVCRTVPAALKFSLPFDTVGSCKVIWLHERQILYLHLQFNPAWPQNWWQRWLTIHKHFFLILSIAAVQMWRDDTVPATLSRYWIALRGSYFWIKVSLTLQSCNTVWCVKISDIHWLGPEKERKKKSKKTFTNIVKLLKHDSRGSHWDLVSLLFFKGKKPNPPDFIL